MTKLVWLFEEHRRLHNEKIQMEKDLAVLTEKYLQVKDDNTRLAESLEKMGLYVREIQTQSPVDLFERYQKQILQDEPYEDGKIPDSAWLTPGDNDARDSRNPGRTGDSDPVLDSVRA